MSLFQFHISNKTYIIFITSILWAINFRTSFNNIDNHMDSGSYSSLKFDIHLILVKNILSIIFILGFIIENQLNKYDHNQKEKELVKTIKGNTLIVELKEKKTHNDSILESVDKIHQLISTKKKIIFWSKNLLIILVIYFIEEMYFIISNNHILDRLVCPIRNLGIFISLLIFSPLIIKKKWVLYRHQLFPLIIILILSFAIILFNLLNIDRFEKIFGFNFLIYLFLFILIGLENALIKYLVDKQFINIFLILGIKGIIGTIVFTIINIITNKFDFYDFFDNLLEFEYEDMYIEFGYFKKILYVISLLLLSYFKVYTINLFTENHLLSVLMITDIIFFPFYCIERFGVQKFGISTPKSFFFNITMGSANFLLMLVFNELLELKFWKLNENFVVNIDKRQQMDYLSSTEKINDQMEMSLKDNKEDSIEY